MIVALLAGALLPPWFLLIVTVPILRVLADCELVEAVGVIGPADLQAYDVVTMMAAVRLAAQALVRRRRIPVCRGTLTFLATLLVTTAIAYLRWGDSTAEQSASLLRLLSQASVLFLLPLALRSGSQARTARRAWLVVGGAAAATVYLELALLPLGLSTGGMSMAGTGVRYFGPLGDEVSFLLPLFLFERLCARRPLGALFFGFATLLTGTRGVLPSLAVGLAVVLWRSRASLRGDRRWMCTLAAFSVAMVVGLLFDPGGTVRRLLDAEAFEVGWLHRASSFEFGVGVFLESPLVGVGFMGFRSLLPPGPAWQGTRSPFNQWLHVACDAGMVGLVAFAWMLVSLSRLFTNASRLDDGRMRSLMEGGNAWLWSLAAGNLTAPWLFPGSLLTHALWVVGGLALASVPVQGGGAARAPASAEPPSARPIADGPVGTVAA
jgi:hypothetical protein